MSKQTIIINGNNFSNIRTFYIEIDNVLTRNLIWKTGHNLSAFNDLLWGGFGVHEYEESIKLIWVNFSNSKKRLGEEFINNLIDIISDHEHIEFITID